MKLKLKNTEEQVELIRAMGSRDNQVSAEASQAFAAFIGPVVQKVLLHCIPIWNSMKMIILAFRWTCGTIKELITYKCGPRILLVACRPQR